MVRGDTSHGIEIQKEVKLYMVARDDHSNFQVKKDILVRIRKLQQEISEVKTVIEIPSES